MPPSLRNSQAATNSDELYRLDASEGDPEDEPEDDQDADDEDEAEEGARAWGNAAPHQARGNAASLTACGLAQPECERQGSTSGIREME